MAIEKIKVKLKGIVDQAQTRLDLESAQNPRLSKAIQIVELFLKRTGRICYGGQAINAQLPDNKKFYDPETALPDYDFFSPDSKADSDGLLTDLKAAGFNEISSRVGIHEGTTKIYVNYTPVADITQVLPELYKPVSEKSVVVNGIHYADPVFLRMMMYLELSRPRGEVDRWTKVYERLRILDSAHPLRKCKGSELSITESKEASEMRAAVARFMIKENRVFMGGDVHLLYRSGRGALRAASSRARFLLHGAAPIVFLSPDADYDSEILSGELGTTRKEIVGLQNLLPPMIALYKGTALIALIVQEEACHSLVTLSLTKGRHIRVASLDTLLTILIGLYYREDSLLMTKEALLCWMREYIDLSEHYRARPTKTFPAFSIECSGYQTGFASLLRAKVARIEAQRQQASSGIRRVKTVRGTHSVTKKRNTLRRTTVKKNRS